MMVMMGGGGVAVVGLPEEGALTFLAALGEQRWQRANLLPIAVRASPT